MNAPFLHRTFVFDALLDRSQRKALDRILDTQRGVYNAALQETRRGIQPGTGAGRRRRPATGFRNRVMMAR